ncbi:MAG: ABC transporter permease [Vicinamibacterales bacterium]
MLRELVEYRHLLLMLTWRDIRVRYKQTAMGFLWALLMPALTVTAGIVVRKAFSIAQGAPLDAAAVASISVKALPWAFVVGSIRFATSSLTNNPTLLTKVYFPREVLPLSAVLASLFDFCVAAVLLAILLAFFGLAPSVQLAWVPVLLVLLVLMTGAAAMLLACANLFFRDVKYLIEVVLTFGIFFTPVLYDARMVGDWESLLLANPVGAILEALNDTVVLHITPDPFWVGYAAVWAVLGFAVASVVFDRAEPAFAERV